MLLINSKKLIENLVSNNRLVPGLLVLFFVSFFYYIKQDILFLLILFILTIYDLFYSKIINLFFSIFFLISFNILLLSNFIIPSHFIFFLAYSLLLISFFLLPKIQKYFFIAILIIFFITLNELLSLDRDLLFLIIVISFVNDTSAFFFGRLIKGPLIIPSISPKKTWSGTLISIFISTLLLLILNYNLIFSLFISFTFFLGDIFFSYFKRNLNIKDFSNLLSGHGGILDRIDSVIFPIIIFYFSKSF